LRSSIKGEKNFSFLITDQKISIMKTEIFEMLRRKFPEGEYALMQEVRNDAGHQASRSADAIAMGLWPSRGLLVHGIELKVSRTDWLKEMKNPEKAEAIFQYCDHFWLLIGSAEVAKIEEVPATWGLMVVTKSCIKIVKEAPRLTPNPLARGFVAAMLKRGTTGVIQPQELQSRVKSASETLIKNKESQWNAEKIRLQNDLTTLQEKVAAFEKSSGIDLNFNRWVATPEKTGNAVRVLLKNGVSDFRSELDRMQKVSSDLTNKIKLSIATLDANNTIN
jgi:hypothetical protein